MGNIEQCLTEAFVEFDRTLTEQSVVRELRIIAGKEVDPDEEVDHKEVDDLFNEATMPIEAVMAQNGSSDSDNTEIASSRNEGGGQSTKTSSSSSTSSSTEKPKTTALTHFKTRNGGGKFKSPAIRAKPACNPDDYPGQKMEDKLKDASGADNVKKLSFSETMEESELSKSSSNGDHENDKETSDKKPTNGHHEAKPDEKVHINGESNNGVSIFCLLAPFLYLLCTMSDFAQFSLMVHLIFIQNVPFLIQDIGVIDKIFDKFYKFSRFSI